MKKIETKEIYDFYSDKRWNNWIQQIKNCNFTMNSNDGNNVTIFINMIDDIVLSCLKIIARYDKKYLNNIESLYHLSLIKKIIFNNTPSISKDIDMMLSSIQNSLICIFSSFEHYIEKSYDDSISIKIMLEEAIEYEKKNNLEISFEILSMIGALIIQENKKYRNEFSNIIDNFKEIIEKSNSIFIDWIDGLESINASLIGTDNYRNFEEEDIEIEL